MNSCVIVLSHHDSRRDKIIDNIIKPLKSKKIKCGIAVPDTVDTTEYNKYGDIIKYNPEDTISKVKNDIIKKYKGSVNYIHIIEDDMVIANPEFISKVEQLMKLLNLPIFTSVTPEAQNTVFGILTPRLRLTDIKIPGFETLEFYMNEAKCYICINLIEFSDNFLFDESMNYFYLSHNYWKRCHTDRSVPFLNFYPTFAGEEEMLYHDSTIPSHITNKEMLDAKHEVEKAALKWETESSVDGPIQRVMGAIEVYNRLHGIQ